MNRFIKIFLFIGWVFVSVSEVCSAGVHGHIEAGKTIIDKYKTSRDNVSVKLMKDAYSSKIEKIIFCNGREVCQEISGDDIIADHLGHIN